MVHHCINLHLPSSSDLLINATEVRAKHRYHAVTVLLFYILKNPSTKALYFLNIYYNTAFQDTILHAVSVTPTSQLCECCYNWLLKIGKYDVWWSPLASFMKNLMKSIQFKSERTETQDCAHAHTAPWLHKLTPHSWQNLLCTYLLWFPTATSALYLVNCFTSTAPNLENSSATWNTNMPLCQ